MAPLARSCELRFGDPIIPIACIPCSDCPAELPEENWDGWTSPPFCLGYTKLKIISERDSHLKKEGMKCSDISIIKAIAKFKVVRLMHIMNCQANFLIVNHKLHQIIRFMVTNKIVWKMYSSPCNNFKLENSYKSLKRKFISHKLRARICYQKSKNKATEQLNRISEWIQCINWVSDGVKPLFQKNENIASEQLKRVNFSRAPLIPFYLNKLSLSDFSISLMRNGKRKSKQQ